MTASDVSRWRLPRYIVWLAFAVGISLGVGGLAVGLDRPPGDLTRPELTARRDRAAAQGFGELAGEVDALGVSVDAVATAGRAALGHASSGDDASLAADIEAGGGALDHAAGDLAAISATLAGLPAGVERTSLSQANQSKLAAVDSAVGAVRALGDPWRRRAAGAVPALRLVAALRVHEETQLPLALAADQAGRYQDALVALDAATAVLDVAERSRDELAGSGIDATAIGDWLLRSRTHDEALKRLYQILAGNGGQPTEEAQAARTRVDESGRAITVGADVLATSLVDGARTAVDDALIAVDQASGALDAASAALGGAGR